MRLKNIFACLLILFPISAFAAANPWNGLSMSQSILKAELPPCTATAKAQNRMFLVRDCTTTVSCASTGTEAALLVCDGTEYRAVNATGDGVALADYVLITKAGQQSITATGAGNDVSVASSDDIILNPTDALTATVGGAAAVTTTAGAITLTAGGTTEDISAISVDQVIFDGAGGADELIIDDDEVLVGAAAAFRLAIAAAPPVACASGTKASMYYDSDINKVCICNGTNYVLANDDSTTTGCS